MSILTRTSTWPLPLTSRACVSPSAPPPATSYGYGQLERWSRKLGEVRAFGVEGIGSYGAGLARFLSGRGFTVVEVNRPDRSTSIAKAPRLGCSPSILVDGRPDRIGIARIRGPSPERLAVRRQGLGGVTESGCQLAMLRAEAAIFTRLSTCPPVGWSSD